MANGSVDFSKWNSHHVCPKCEVMTALMATRDDDGRLFLLQGVFMWYGDRWGREEDRFCELPKLFWWKSEKAVLRDLTAIVDRLDSGKLIQDYACA
jgi:hypothetical protein